MGVMSKQTEIHHVKRGLMVIIIKRGLSVYHIKRDYAFIMAKEA